MYPIAICFCIAFFILYFSLEILLTCSSVGSCVHISTHMILLILVCLVSQATCEDGHAIEGSFLGDPQMKGIYPYMVFIEPVRCTGSIISNSWVVTAAHCFDIRYKGLMELYAGLVNNVDNTSAQFRTATSVDHPKYQVNRTLESRFFDIALLHTTRPFIFSPSVDAITLADGPLPQKEGRCKAVGFGLNEDPHKGENALKWMVVLLGGERLCDKYAQKYDYPTYIFGKHMICASTVEESGKTFCSADSGSPVVCGGVLVGVLMAVFSKNKRLDPQCGTTTAIYAYIGHHIPWIQSVVTDELFTTQIGYEGLYKSVDVRSAPTATASRQRPRLLVEMMAIMLLFLESGSMLVDPQK